ncbi:MAG: hypothetical protein KAT70_00395, partial [Thermoplasmata archaeon]|nr:hypothetical protein [Thermoplasmata archaeon]
MAQETRWDEFFKAYTSSIDYPNEEPGVSITHPSDMEIILQTGPYTIDGTANDIADAGTVSRVELKIDRDDWFTATGTTAWSYEWDPTTVDQGTHYIWARSFDGTDYSNYVCHQVTVTLVSIEHTPLGDTEDTTGPYVIEANISGGDGGIDPNTCDVRYSYDQGSWSTDSMSHVGDAYTGEIPGYDGDVYYYIRASDMSAHQETDPVDANEGDFNSVYLFHAGDDVIDPVIVHTVLTDTANAQGPYPVFATITDNIGVASVTLYYQRGAEVQQSVAMNNIGNEYSAEIPGPVTAGTTVRYYIEAVDSSNAPPNTATDPAGAPAVRHSFDLLTDIAPPVIIHTPLVDVPSNNPYRVFATITDGGVLNTSALYVCYNTDGGSVFTQLPMNPTATSDEYEAYIPGQPTFTTIYYYINASDMADPANIGTRPVTAPGTPYNFDIIETLPLLVVNAGGDLINYTLALDNLGMVYDTGTPISADLTYYRNVIWVEAFADGPSQEDQTNLSIFLDNGGNLYINGEDIGWKIGYSAFYSNYLHAVYDGDNALGPTTVTGVIGDPITDGMVDFAIAGDAPERIHGADDNASVIFNYTDGYYPDTPAAIKVDNGTYKVVYLGIEYFDGTDPQANKDLLMRRILGWLDPLFEEPVIVHTPLPNTEDTKNAYVVIANITDNNLGTC